jgi:hypothetical protein
MTEQYINFITLNSVPKTMTLQEIINATNSDAALTALHDAIKVAPYTFHHRGTGT